MHRWVFYFALAALATCRASGMSIPLGADDLLIARRWQTEDGLPQNSVLTIVQTPDGYLWLGTFNGLVRFDGVRFQAFTVGNTPELRSDFVNILRVGSDGSLWIGTGGGGLLRYQNGRFRAFSKADGLDEPDLYFLANSPAGELLAATWESVYRFDGVRFVRVAQLQPELRPIAQMAFDRNQELWLSTAKGLRQLRLDGVLEAAATRDPAAARAYQGSGLCDVANSVWRTPGGELAAGAELKDGPVVLVASSQDGLWSLNWSDHEHEGLTLTRAGRSWNFRSHPFLNRHDICSLFADPVGNLWVGLDGGGLVRFRPKQIRTYSVAQGLPSENTVSLALDEQERIWLCRLGAKSGVSWLSPREENLIPDVEGFERQLASSCYRAHDGTMWVGTVANGLFSWRDGMVERRVTGPLPHLRPNQTMVRVLFEDRAGGFWIGTESKGAVRFKDGKEQEFTRQNGLSHDKVTAIAEDRDGAIWIGTAGGLNRLGPDGVLRKFSRRDGLGVDVVHCVFVDSDNAVWIGTAGGGLSMFTGTGFVTVSTKHGLLDDVVAQILEDNQGNLWIGTNRGIARLLRSELQALIQGNIRFVHSLSYGAGAGMVSEECGGGFQPSSLKDHHGRLWFCTVGGVVAIDPAESRPQSMPPRVYIEEAQVDNVEHRFLPDVSGGKGGLVVPPDTHSVEIRYTGLEFSAPETVVFRHKLEDYDLDWIDSGTRRRAFYTRIPPGQYRFRVQAANNEGVWNLTGASLAITVLPSWWQTPQFSVLISAGIALLVGGAYHLRVRHFKRERTRQADFSRRLIESQEAERQRISRELHDSLGLGFAVIKNRAHLALKDAQDSSALQGHLKVISEVSSDAVREVRQISHALHPAQLERLGLSRSIETLAEETAKSGDLRLTKQVENVDELFQASQQANLLRITQETLNNILKHARASSLDIALRRNGACVQLSIADDGRGFEANEHRSGGQGGCIGLLTLRERVGILNGRLEIESVAGQGTRLTVTIPVRS